jgi:hypothetical protein
MEVAMLRLRVRINSQYKRVVTLNLKDLTLNDALNMSIEQLKEIADSYVVKSGITFIDGKLKDGELKLTISLTEFSKFPKDEKSRYELIKKLQGMGLTQMEISRVAGKTQSLISKIISKYEINEGGLFNGKQ